MLKASFKEVRIKLDSESLHFEVYLRLADGSYFIFEFFFQVEIKLVSEGFIVPLHILFLRFKSRCIFYCGASLVATMIFSYCHSLQIGIPIDAGEGIREGIERCEFERGQFNNIGCRRDQRLKP